MYSSQRFINKGPKAALAVAMLCVINAAWAGRPIVTEDASILDKGICELETFVSRFDEPRLTLATAQVGCGIGVSTQLGVGVARTSDSEPNTSYAAFGGKTAIRPLSAEQAGIVIAYGMLGDRIKGEDWQYATAEIKGVITIPYQGWLLHANAGLLHTYAGEENRATWAFAAEQPDAIGPVTLIAEAFGDNKYAPWVQLAARWTVIPDRFYLDGSLGRQTNSDHTTLATIGMKLVFK